MSWDEDTIHRWLKSGARPRALVGSVGHDAAVTKALEGRLVSCLDQCIEGVHVESDTSPTAFGRKAVNRALSDLAATAATPRGVLIGLSASMQRDNRWVRAVITGARRAAACVGAEVWGGDLSAAEGPARLSITALGELPGRAKPVGRDRARDGQWVLCTGSVGGSILGRHLKFTPRIAAGAILHAAGATAMMDVSDGLAWDAHRLARASGVCIELSSIPVHRDALRRAKQTGKPALWHALHDGEDHELIATLSAPRARDVLREAQLRGDPWVCIGRVVDGKGLRLVGQAAGQDSATTRARLWSPAEGGWRHGR